MREIWFAVLVASTLVGGLPASAQAQADTAKAASLLAVGKEDRILGKPNAPVTIIEYGSLSCPHCAHFAADVLPQLKKQWIDTGKARLIFRDFPLDQEAMAAETVARCAVPPARYYPLIDMMFANQDRWVVEQDWRAALQRLVQLAGISKKQFDACLANKTIEDQVAQSRLIASQQLGVDATPTFFINGKKFEGAPTEEALSANLTEVYAQAAPTTAERQAAGVQAAPVTAAAPKETATAAAKPAPASTQAAATPATPGKQEQNATREGEQRTAAAPAAPAAAGAKTTVPAAQATARNQPPIPVWARMWGWFMSLFGRAS